MHNLLEVKHKKRKLDLIVFPQVDSMDTWLTGSVGRRARLPDGGRLRRHDEGGVHQGVRHLRRQRDHCTSCPFVHMREPKLCKREMLAYFGDVFGLSEQENSDAVDEGYKAQEKFVANLRVKGREVLEEIEREQSARRSCCWRARITTTRA